MPINQPQAQTVQPRPPSDFDPRIWSFPATPPDIFPHQLMQMMGRNHESRAGRCRSRWRVKRRRSAYPDGWVRDWIARHPPTVVQPGGDHEPHTGTVSGDDDRAWSAQADYSRHPEDHHTQLRRAQGHRRARACAACWRIWVWRSTTPGDRSVCSRLMRPTAMTIGMRWPAYAGSTGGTRCRNSSTPIRRHGWLRSVIGRPTSEPCSPGRRCRRPGCCYVRNQD